MESMACLASQENGAHLVKRAVKVSGPSPFQLNQDPTVFHLNQV
jgi:hypothetical protein